MLLINFRLYVNYNLIRDSENTQISKNIRPIKNPIKVHVLALSEARFAPS